MPRNACAECRTRKLKCIDLGYDQKCQRCQNRNTDCTYLVNIRRKRRISNNASSAGSKDEPETSSSPPSLNPRAPGQLGPLVNNSSGLDIGDGSPAELLREQQLTQTLLLLYFSNYNDVHFMFDQSIFLRQYALGNCPKVLLYAMMALGIRYSHAPFKDPQRRAHWGEPLYKEARRLLKDDFDHPSIINIQAYVLLASYHLAFGGSRKACIYLNSARSFALALDVQLQVHPTADQNDAVQAELSRRLIATIMLMENTLIPCLGITQAFSLVSVFPMPHLCSEEEFNRIKTGKNKDTLETSCPNVMQEILVSSDIYSQACWGYRKSTLCEDSELTKRLSKWTSNLHAQLQYTEVNFKVYQDRFMLRPFVFMHTLYHLTWEIVLFKSLEWSTAIFNGSTPVTERTLRMYHHASEISRIVSHVWDYAGFDFHNAPFGQALILSGVSLVHQLLSTCERSSRLNLRNQILVLRNSLVRVKQHSRLFDFVYNQLECFFRVCSQDAFWEQERWGPLLHDQTVMLGTAFERFNYETAGRTEGLEQLLHFQSSTEQEVNQVPKILREDFDNMS